MDTPGLVDRPTRFKLFVPLLVASSIAAFAIALRTSMLFSKVLPPGIDAAYYPMQARGVLENGKLPYVEVPLIFWIDAALAKALVVTRGMDVDSATLFASRLVDAVSQPLAAIPLALLMIGFAGALRAARSTKSSSDADPNAASERKFPLLPVVIGVFTVSAIAILSPPILRMTGDFQKNSLGLVWMAASAWATYRALSKGGLIRWIPVVAFAALAAITHIGAFGVTMVLVASTIGVFVLTKWRMKPKTIAIATVACVVGAGAMWSLTYAVAPSKAMGLVQGVMKMFTVGDRPQGRPALASGLGSPGPKFDGPPRDGRDGGDVGSRDGDSLDRPIRDGGPPDRQGGGPPGPPGGFPASALPFRAAAWAVLLAFGGLAIWRARRIGVAELAIVSGAVITSALVMCPLIQGQYAERLSLMTPIPLSIIVGFLLTSWAESARRWVRISGSAIGALAGIVILVIAIPMAVRGKRGPPQRAFANNGSDGARRQGPGGLGGPGGGGGGSVVADEAVPEFRSMRGIVPTDGSAVVIARHGLQWWAGYFLKTPVREEHATKEQLEKYDRVFVLTEKRSGNGPGPDRGDQDGPRRPPDGGSMIRVPPNAEVVHDGEFYKLVLLPAAAAR
ncbi:MAG: hypothetical protein ACREJD_09035 [Phycisphaerales bacterium]